MKKQEVIDLASRRGLCVYEQYKGRKLTKKLSDQKTKQEELKTKIDAAKEAYEKSTAETGKNSEQSKALKDELDKLEKEFTANETAIGKTETALANQTVKTEKSKTALMNMEAELKNVNDQLKDNKLEKFATACDTAGTKMESFGKKMSVVSAGIAGIGAASIKAFTELDEGYDTIVTKTGATGEALEGLTKSADNVFGTMPEDMSTVGEAIGEVNTRRKCSACDIFPDVRGFGCQQQDAFTLRSHTDSVHDRRAGDDRSKAER